jgi:hypothetical protein
MTKRGVPAIALVLIAALGFCGAASAQTGALKVSAAKKLARALAEKQVRGRDIVSFHITSAKRHGSNVVTFAYDDRSTSNVYCTAALVVTRKVGAAKTVTSARFSGQKCAGIPSDVLAVEAATRDAVRALRSTTVQTADALDGLQSSVNRCRKLSVPKSRRAAAAAVVDIATVEALVGPNDAALSDFVSALGNVQTSNATLAGGIAGWTDELAAIHSLPAIADPCATLRTWSHAGWSADQSPIDLAAYSAVTKRTNADERAITRTARYLALSGVFPRTVVKFTPEGLLLRLAPKVGTTGGKTNGKLVLRKPAVL